MLRRLVVLGCIANLVIGLGQLALGSVMEPMVHAYGVLYSDGGQLVMNQFLGTMTGMLLVPWMLKRFGARTVMYSAFAMIAIGEAIYSLQPPWMVMLSIAPFTGFGMGSTEALVGALVIGYSGERANVNMTRVDMFFGIGALGLPLAGAFFISAGNWKLTFALVGLMSLATLLLWVWRWPSILDKPLSAPAEGEQGARKAKSGMGRRSRWILGVCMLFFFVYVGLEMSYVHYFPSLLVKNNGLPESSAALAISLFWTAMAIGRMLSGYAADRWGTAAYMLVTCGATLALFLFMLGFDSTVGSLTLNFMAGLSMSGMFAIMLVYAGKAVTGMTDRTTSLLMACGGIGGAFLPKLTGWVLDRTSVGGTYVLFAIVAAVMLVVAAWAMYAGRTARDRMEVGLS